MLLQGIEFYIFSLCHLKFFNFKKEADFFTSLIGYNWDIWIAR